MTYTSHIDGIFNTINSYKFFGSFNFFSNLIPYILFFLLVNSFFFIFNVDTERQSGFTFSLLYKFLIFFKTSLVVLFICLFSLLDLCDYHRAVLGLDCLCTSF